MFIHLNLTGQTHKSRSKPLSNQLTQNFYSELLDVNNAKSPYVLHGFPGMSYLSTSVGGKDRGMIFHKQLLYKVSGEKLYKIESDFTQTELGDIPGTT